ncbi:hypothetical protein OGAPHI_006439 [Ogataea philodendri]|uniref:Uncharacterized protein n=1 Tax=Ogataea philodendri TaxID=1378263 RepID=A0A9P8T0M2_9ASCO|nr:uncharacterized protein OGAPHI_006439 [Ogataea philodendri]KAH3661591.1 hypothetical protein OGAPHI_006439 [Ogataea philodendri]
MGLDSRNVFGTQHGNQSRQNSVSRSSLDNIGKVCGDLSQSVTASILYSWVLILQRWENKVQNLWNLADQHFSATFSGRRKCHQRSLSLMPVLRLDHLRQVLEKRPGQRLSTKLESGSVQRLSCSIVLFLIVNVVDLVRIVPLG